MNSKLDNMKKYIAEEDEFYDEHKHLNTYRVLSGNVIYNKYSRCIKLVTGGLSFEEAWEFVNL